MITFQKISRFMLFVGALTIAACVSGAQEQTPSTEPAMQDMRAIRIHNPPQTAPSFTLALNPGTRNKNISEFRVGSRVWITVKMTNITNHAIDISGSFTDAGNASYSWEVRDEDGKPAEKIAHLHPEMVTGSPFWSGILPGDSNIGEVQLDRVYKLDRPGKYTVQVSRADQDCPDANGKPVVVKSNTITITITG